MSSLQNIDVTLWAPYTKNVLEMLVNRGAELGFVYYDSYIFMQGVSEEKKILTTMEALHKILFHSSETEKNSGAYVEVQFEEIRCLIRVYESDGGSTIVSMSNFAPGWKKSFFGNTYRFDFGRHIQLMIMLCEGFAIVKLEAEDF